MPARSGQGSRVARPESGSRARDGSETLTPEMDPLAPSHEEPWLTDAFRPGVAAAKTITARRVTAEAIISQLRTRDELLGEERATGLATLRLEAGRREHAPPLGDEVLLTDPARILAVLGDERGLRVIRRVAWDAERIPGAPTTRGTSSLHERLARLSPDQRRRLLRCVYGYDRAEWDGGPGSERLARRGDRLTARIAVCLAADLAFAPYAAGLMRAIAERPATLAIGLRSTCHLIWAWASEEHRALARALAIARRVTSRPPVDDDAVMPFEPFTTVFSRVLARYTTDAINVARVAGLLSSLALRQLPRVEDGRFADRNLGGPARELIQRECPHWLGLTDEVAEESFARGAAPILIEVIRGHRRPHEALRPLEALGTELDRLRGDPRSTGAGT